MSLTEAPSGRAPGPPPDPGGSGADAPEGAPGLDAPGPAAAGPPARSAQPGSVGRGRLRRVLRVAPVVALVALVAATVGLRVELDARRHDARQAEAAAARTARARSDAALAADALVAHLDRSERAGRAAAASRAEQVARLQALGLTEADMDAALADARAATRSAEGRRDALASDVERQAGEDVELQACLAEVRRAVDAAFHAAHRAGVDVPVTRELCRALLAGRPGP